MRVLLLVLLAACGVEGAPDPDDHTDVADLPDPPAQREGPPNILFVLLDDVGLDKTSAYDEHPSPPPTPVLEDLAARGVRFTQVYAEPTCSIARASLLTGRHPFRHGIGRWIFPEGGTESLPDEEVTLAELLAQADPPYTSALAGKWHLVGYDTPDPARHPLRQGFAHHRGSLSNPLDILGEKPPYTRSYTRWQKAVDGAVEMTDTYMTLDTTDEALGLMARLPEPWFLYVAYNAAHDPWAPPPAPLPGSEVRANAPAHERYAGMVRAVDHELGRLLEGLDGVLAERTLIVVASDNGTPKDVITTPSDRTRGKHTVYEGGVRVPFLVAGAGVERAAGSTSDALLSFVDVFPTLAEVAGVPLAEVQGGDGGPLVIDGTSFLGELQAEPPPAPDRVLYAETFWPLGPPPWDWHRWTVRDASWKLAEEPKGRVKLFALDGSMDEGNDLLGRALTAEQEAAMTRLEAARDALFEQAGLLP
ncbi:MAG: sulfatase-like hydrolase/transferase [Alphaproteobacteria bacterium]|nr:sulfatase-like hydrolase/transferase [Alphaproteobacteria bacterium]